MEEEFVSDKYLGTDDDTSKRPIMSNTCNVSTDVIIVESRIFILRLAWLAQTLTWAKI